MIFSLCVCANIIRHDVHVGKASPLFALPILGHAVSIMGMNLAAPPSVSTRAVSANLSRPV